MKCVRILAAALLLGAGGIASAADTDAQFRLNELLSDEQYREAWQEVIEDESRLPEWVMNLSGEAQPMKALEDDGDKFLVGKLCEPQQCFNQRLYAAFTWDKQRAYGLMVEVPTGLPKDKAPSGHATFRWLGEPDEAVKRLLQEQLKDDPNWF
ncbi:MAG: inhibitor of vertebrate lysozyme family protein [Pseudomonadota bacterium]